MYICIYAELYIYISVCIYVFRFLDTHPRHTKQTRKVKHHTNDTKNSKYKFFKNGRIISNKTLYTHRVPRPLHIRRKKKFRRKKKSPVLRHAAAATLAIHAAFFSSTRQYVPNQKRRFDRRNAARARRRWTQRQRSASREHAVRRRSSTRAITDASHTHRRWFNRNNVDASYGDYRGSTESGHGRDAHRIRLNASRYFESVRHLADVWTHVVSLMRRHRMQTTLAESITGYKGILETCVRRARILARFGRPVHTCTKLSDGSFKRAMCASANVVTCCGGTVHRRGGGGIGMEERVPDAFFIHDSTHELVAYPLMSVQPTRRRNHRRASTHLSPSLGVCVCARYLHHGCNELVLLYIFLCRHR